jgi:hypothetical protein
VYAPPPPGNRRLFNRQAAVLAQRFLSVNTRTGISCGVVRVCACSDSAGDPFNSPHRVVARSSGDLYITDPPLGLAHGEESVLYHGYAGVYWYRCVCVTAADSRRLSLGSDVAAVFAQCQPVAPPPSPPSPQEFGLSAAEDLHAGMSRDAVT